MSQDSKVMTVDEIFQQQGQVLELSPDDKKGLQQIYSTHSGTEPRMEAKSLKSIVNICKNILLEVSPSSFPFSKEDCAVPDDKASVITDALKSTIHKIGCELSCNSTGEGDMNAITLSVFNTLKKYAWETKVVLVLAAFTDSYWKLCFLSQRASDRLARNVYMLNPLPDDISEQKSLITGLLMVVVQMTSCIIQLIDIPAQDRPTLCHNMVPTSIYLAIKGIAACSVLVNVGHQSAVLITEAKKKLTELTQTLKICYGQLTEHLKKWHKDTNDKMNDQVCINLVHTIYETTHTDSRETFTAFIDTKEELPLFNGVDKRRVSLDVLKGQTVMYFFSYHDISEKEIEEVKQQVGKQERKYEIVWMPIINEQVMSTYQIKKEIFQKASSMQWYSLHNSLELRPGAVKFIKEMWHFDKKPLLVAFNAQGNIISEKAYNMLMTRWSIQDLLEEESDRKDLVQKEKLVCFYGGDDIDWIRKFVPEIKKVQRGGVILELIYVGKKRKETISKESLSKCWDGLQIKRFRARLDTIMNSKMQLGLTIKTDAVFKDVMTMLGAEGSGEGWMLLAHESEDMVTMNANLAMEWLAQLNNAKVTITSENFFDMVFKVYKEKAYKEKVDVKDPPKHCNCIVVTNTNVINQESMVCVDCNRSMEKVTMYRCCREE